MATGAKIIQVYKKSTHKKRLDLLCDNYSRLDNILSADVNVLKLIIVDDRASKKREEKGDLGIRVQTSNISKPTEEQGITNVMLEEAIIACDFSSGIIEGLDHEFFVMDRAETLLMIRNDLTKFNDQLDCLDDDDKDFFLLYIGKVKRIDDLADELGITYKSTQKRITRIKNQINMGMNPLDYV